MNTGGIVLYGRVSARGAAALATAALSPASGWAFFSARVLPGQPAVGCPGW